MCNQWHNTNHHKNRIGKFYEITKAIGAQYDRQMANWKHPATHVKITEGYDDISHPIQAYTDGSKNNLGAVAGISILLEII